MSPEDTPQDQFVLPEDFKFNPDSVLDDLTFGDAEDIEEATGIPIGELQSSVRGLRGMIWALLRKDYPELKFEQTRNLPMSTLLDDAKVAEIKKAQEPADAEGKDGQ